MASQLVGALGRPVAVAEDQRTLDGRQITADQAAQQRQEYEMLKQ